MYLCVQIFNIWRKKFNSGDESKTHVTNPKKEQKLKKILEDDIQTDFESHMLFPDVCFLIGTCVQIIVHLNLDGPFQFLTYTTY